MQPTHEGFADIDWQRQWLDAVALAADHDLPGAPIEVTQPQSGHLAGVARAGIAR